MPKSDKQKKALVINLGCPKNDVDSEVISGIIQKIGYTLIDNDEEIFFSFTDEELYLAIDTNLGDIYKWNPDPPDRLTGSTLSFKSTSKTLDRLESTTSSAGKWN